MDILRRLFFVLVLVLCLSTPAAARADVIDSILYLIDPDLATSRPLIDCLVQGNSVDTCAKQCADQAASDEIAKMMAEDSTIALAANIIKAATKKPQGDWARVLELAGVDLTFKIACNVGIPTGGPVKSFICGPLFAPLLNAAKPFVRETLIAIRDKDWLRLVALLGPETACKLIPGDDPLSGTVCSVLADLVGKLTGAAGDAAHAAWSQIEDWSEDLQGQTQHMSYDEFYARYIRHLTHKRALQRIISGRSSLGLDSGEYDSCVKYFDSHKQAKDTAQKTCSDLSNRLHKESMALADFAQAVPQSYFDTALKPAVADLVAERYWTDEAENFQTFIFGLQPQKWGLGNFPSPTTVFFGEYNKCYRGMVEMLYGGNPYPVYPEMAPDSLRDWGCYQAAGLKFAKALTTEKLRLILNVKPKLTAASCTLAQSADSKSVVYKCGNFDAYVTCKEYFKDYRYEHCRIDKVAADISLGKKLAAILGKRCTFVETSKEGYHDPKVICTREWKHQQCDQLLQQQLQNPALADHPFTQATVKCTFLLEPSYKQGKEKAEAIIQALNAPHAPPGDSGGGVVNTNTAGISTSGVLMQEKKTLNVEKAPSMREKLVQAMIQDNCRATWDPLALHCKNPKVLQELPDRLPGTVLPKCAADPAKDGADAPCYAGAYAYSPPNQGVVITQPELSGGAPGAKKSPVVIGGIATAELIEKKFAVPELPELVATADFTMSGQRARWGGSLTLQAGSLKPVFGGGCRVDVDYTVENRGAALSPAAARDQWTVTGRKPDVLGTVGRIPPGEKRRQQVTLRLYPGTNQVTLKIDPENKIPEISESNNIHQISVMLAGTCGDTLRQNNRISPGTERPGIQLDSGGR